MLAEARLRPSGYNEAAFATRGLAQPKQARPAKDGGARRDRTADLLHAMQALSQLSYGPEHLAALWGVQRLAHQVRVSNRSGLNAKRMSASRIRAKNHT